MKKAIKNSNLKVSVAQFITSLFIFLFAYTAFSKLMEVEKFKAMLSKAPLISPIASIIAYVLPLLEMLIVVCLALPRFRKIGLWSSFVLLALFTLYISCMIAFSPDLPCPCGGIISQLSWYQHILFNFIFMGLAFISIHWIETINPKAENAVA